MHLSALVRLWFTKACLSSALQADSSFAKKWLIRTGPVCTNSKYKKHYRREVNLFVFGTAMAKYEFAFTCRLLLRWRYFSWSSGKKIIQCYKDWVLCLKLYIVLFFKALNKLCCPHSPWLLLCFFLTFQLYLPWRWAGRGSPSDLCPCAAQGCHPSAPKNWKRFLGKEQRPRDGWLQWIILFPALRINNNLFIF